MANYLTTDTDLTTVANAIRTKGGTSAPLSFPSGFAQAIADIPSGGGVTHPFAIVKSIWEQTDVTIAIGNWSHTFQFPCCSNENHCITYEDLLNNGWDGEDSFSITITVHVPSATLTTKRQFFGAWSFAYPDNTLIQSNSGSSDLVVNWSTSSDSMSGTSYNAFCLIVTSLTNF